MKPPFFFRNYPAAISLAVIASAVYLQISTVGGRLAVDLSYDDVVYAIDGAERYMSACRDGLFALLASFVMHPPHSPYSTLLAVMGFAIGGVNDFSFYAVNAASLALVAILVMRELRCTGTAARLVLLVVVLASPLAAHLIEDSRPDIASGFATAMMVWWFISGVVDGDRTKIRAAAFALAAALLIKPTFFAHTLAMAIGLIAMPLLARVPLLRKWGWNLHFEARQLLWFPGIGLLIAAPYFAINGGNTFHHFWDNTLGSYAGHWSYPSTMPVLELIDRTLRQDAPLIGYHALLALLVSAASLVILIRRGSMEQARKIAVLLISALASAVLITSGRHMNGFFLASAQWMLLLCGVFAADAVLSTSNHRKALVAALASALFIVVCANATVPGGMSTDPDAARGISWDDKNVDVIRAHEGFEFYANSSYAPKVFFSFIGPVDPAALKWAAIKKRISLLTYNSIFEKDLSVVQSNAVANDYVVVPNQTLAHYVHASPDDELQGRIASWIASDPHFKLLTAFDDPYFVFARVKTSADNDDHTLSANGIVLLSGFADEEGPYPKLGRVRWMTSKSASVCLLNPSSAQNVTLTLRRTLGQLEVRDDAGSLLASADVNAGSSDTVTLMFPLAPKAPRPCVHLQARLDEPFREDRIFLFSKIALVPADVR